MSPTGDPLIARVVPDVTGLDKQFDYLVPEALRAQLAIGSLVRVPLHGRRVGGWVVELVGAGEAGVAGDRLVPIAKWSSIGPAADVIELGEWATWRWAANRLRPFLAVASPPTMVASLPALRRTVHAATAAQSAVHRVAPNTDPLPIALAVARSGPTIIVHPSPAAARAIAARVRKAGFTTALLPDEWARAAAGVDVVVGSRGAVWGPCPGLRAIVVLEEHDDALQEERTPTWHARDVAIERAARAGAACVLVSPSPTVTALEWAGADAVIRPALADERAGWPTVEIVDRTQEEPWKKSLVTSALIRHLRSPGTRVVCVLNTVGRARLLACRSCRSLQRCERCAAAVAQADDGSLVCARCGQQRPPVCQHCGSGALALVKLGVTRAREELEAAAGRPVVAITGESTELEPSEIYVGTEAVLHRVRGADVVAFLDLDAELLAPRYRAAEQAMTLLIRAARLVGPRDGGGRILVQTFLPHHEVLQAAVFAAPQRLAVPETERRRALALPPFGALAAVSGAGAGDYATATGLPSAIAGDDVLLRAGDWDELADALAAAPRPKGSRLRVEVDPARR